MKKTILSILALLAVGLVLTAGGCDSTTSDNNRDSASSGIDFTTNYASTGDYLIKVTNNYQGKLVAFYGEPSGDTLIGGIPAGTANWGLKKPSNVTTGDFICFLVKEEDYITYKDDLAQLKYHPFGKLYACYNADAKTNYVYQISSLMNGSFTITVNNNTAYNMELRQGGIYGETIGYAPAHALETTFYVSSGDYYVYPVFRQYDRSLAEIVTVYPKKSNGSAWSKSFALSDSFKAVAINAQDFVSSVSFSTGCAYIRIINSSENAIQFYYGANSAATTTSEGVSLINSGATYTYSLEMPLDKSDSSTETYEYASSVTTNQLYVGSAQVSRVKLNDDTLSFEGGKTYEFIITGDSTDPLIGLTSTYKSENTKSVGFTDIALDSSASN